MQPRRAKSDGGEPSRGAFSAKKTTRQEKREREDTMGDMTRHTNGNSMPPGGLTETTSTRDRERADDLAAVVTAIDKSMARIEFTPDGTILEANGPFCSTVGYSLDEIRGRHHRMFVDPTYSSSPEYARFWQNLQDGRFQADQYKRFAKGGREVWIQASYNPIFDKTGRVVKVVKFATDITAQKNQTADMEGQLQAIDKSMAVIEFNLDGTVVRANEAFCIDARLLLRSNQRPPSPDVRLAVRVAEPRVRTLLAVSSAKANSKPRNTSGSETAAGEIWIQASYNPIMDLNGKPCKVVKFATDITDQKRAEMRQKELIQAVEINASGLGSSATELSAISQTMTANAEETSAQASVVSSRVRASEQERADGRHVGRGDEREHPRNREERDRRSSRRHASGEGRRNDQHVGRQARRVERANRKGHQSHHEHRAANEPSRAQRDDRSGARR